MGSTTVWISTWCPIPEQVHLDLEETSLDLFTWKTSDAPCQRYSKEYWTRIQLLQRASRDFVSNESSAWLQSCSSVHFALPGFLLPFAHRLCDIKIYDIHVRILWDLWWCGSNSFLQLLPSSGFFACESAIQLYKSEYSITCSWMSSLPWLLTYSMPDSLQQRINIQTRRDTIFWLGRGSCWVV